MLRNFPERMMQKRKQEVLLSFRQLWQKTT